MVKTKLTAFTDKKIWPFKSILQTHQVLNKSFKKVNVLSLRRYRNEYKYQWEKILLKVVNIQSSIECSV